VDEPAGEHADTLILDYRSGPFTDFLTRGEPDPGEAGSGEPGPAPGSPPASPPLPAPASLPAYGDETAPPRPPARRRRRTLAIVLALVVLGAIVTGAIALIRHQSTVPRASAPTPHRDVASHPTTPTASPRRTPGLPVGAAGWTAPAPIGGGTTVTGLSCPRVTVCYAVDSAGNFLSSTSTSAARRGAWQVVASDPGGGLVAISCPSAGFCLAVDEAGNAITMSHGSWSSPVYVNARLGTFTAVSCPVASFCMAVDSGGNAFAYDVTSNTWQPFTVDASGGALTAVSCAGPGRCVAVDGAGGAYTYDGGSWSGAFPVDAGNAFTAVSCASRAFCAATDAGGNGAILTGGTWTVSPMGTAARALACPAAGFCMATTASGGAVAYRNGAWSPMTRIDGRRVIGLVSCAAPTACTAVDRQDNVLYYAPPPSG